MPLDIALPTFAWGVAFRKGVFHGIFNHWTEGFCAKQSFLQESAPQNWVCIKDTTYKGHFWRMVDRLRTEACSPEAIHELQAMTTDLRPTDAFSVALFSWDTAAYRSYQPQKLNAIFEDYE